MANSLDLLHLFQVKMTVKEVGHYQTEVIVRV